MGLHNTTIDNGLVCTSCTGDYVLECSGCGGAAGALPTDELVELARQHITPLSTPQKVLLNEMLIENEHELHARFKEDFLTHDGAHWKELHTQRSDQLVLRQQFGLPDHEFGECCKRYVDSRADVYTERALPVPQEESEDNG